MKKRSQEKWWENWKLQEDITDLIYLTKHPPKKDISQEALNKSPAHIKATPEDLHNGLFEQLMTGGVAFKNTQNPIHLFEAFLRAHEAGLYPPMWALNYIAKVFTFYHEEQGTKSLDDLFGLKPGKGQTPLYKKDREELRDQRLCRDVYLLNTLFNFTIDDAANMAARRLQDNPNWDKTGLKLIAISEDTIKDRYHKKWKEEDLRMTKEEKIEFLKIFPEDSFPTKPGKTFKEIIEKIMV